MTVINEKFVINTQGHTDIIDITKICPEFGLQALFAKRVRLGLCGGKYSFDYKY